MRNTKKQATPFQEMSLAEFLTVAINPIQRDTPARAKKSNHLKKLQPTHQFVHMARLKGKLILLDGHTRQLMWKEGTAERPDVVHACIIDCTSMTQVEDYYKHYDNSKAVERKNDQANGAARKLGLHFTSPMLRTGNFTTALGILGFKDVYQGTTAWKEQLQVMDMLNVEKSTCHQGVLAAALLTLKHHGIERAVGFWKALIQGDGVETKFGYDGVVALRRFIGERKQMKGSGGGGVAKLVFEKALFAFELWHRNRILPHGKGELGSFTLDEYLAQMEMFAGTELMPSEQAA